MAFLTDEDVGLAESKATGLTDEDVGLGEAEPTGSLSPAESLILRPRPSTLVSTTAGGPPVPLASFHETMAEPAAVGQAMEERFWEPSIPLPRLPTVEDKPPTAAEQILAGAAGLGPASVISPKAPSALMRGAVNLAIGLPEFATSPGGAAVSILGPAAAGAGKAGQVINRLVAAGFSLDMLKGFGEQLSQTVKEWPQMTPEQKAVSIENMAGSLGLAGTLGLGAARGHRAAPVRSEAVEKPPVVPPPRIADTMMAEEVARAKAEAEARPVPADFVPEPEPTETVVKAEEFPPAVTVPKPPEARAAEPATPAPATVETAGEILPEGKVFQVVWADGRGVQFFDNRKAAEEFAAQPDRDASPIEIVDKPKGARVKSESPPPEPAAPAAQPEGEQHAQVKKPETGQIPPKPSEPTEPKPEVQAEAGTAQREGQGEAKQPWEMTREAFGQDNIRRAEKSPDLPPLPPAEFEVLKSLSDKVNRRPYNPDLLTESALEKLGDMGLVSGSLKKPKITPDGHSQLLEWTRTRREYDLALGNIADKMMDEAMDVHKASVEQALREGKPVPESVLADYPELGKKAEPSLPKPKAIDYQDRNKVPGEHYRAKPNSIVIQFRGLDTEPLRTGKPFEFPFTGDMKKAGATIMNAFRQARDQGLDFSYRETPVIATDANGNAVHHFKVNPAEGTVSATSHAEIVEARKQYREMTSGKAAEPSPAEPESKALPESTPSTKMQAEVSKGAAYVMKDPSGNAVESSAPEQGRQYFRRAEDGNLYRVRYDGVTGRFDQHTIHSWTWLEGPNKGNRSTQYGQGGFYGAKKQVAEPYVPSEFGPVQDRFSAEAEMKQARIDARKSTGRTRELLNERARFLSERIKQIDEYSAAEESKRKQQPSTPSSKMQAEVSKVAKSDGQRPAKEVKSELVQRLEESVKNAPSILDEAPEGWQPKITIDIPGDGTFTILNHKETIQRVLNRALKIETKPTESKAQKPRKSYGVDPNDPHSYDLAKQREQRETLRAVQDVHGETTRGYRAAEKMGIRAPKEWLKTPDEPTPPAEAPKGKAETPSEPVHNLTPAESARLAELTAKLESGQTLTAAERKRYHDLKNKSQPPEPEQGGVEAGPMEGEELENISPGNTVAGYKPALTPRQIEKQEKYRSIFISSKNAYEALRRSVDEGMLNGARLEISKELLKHGDLGVKLNTGGEFYARGWGSKAAGLYDKDTDTIHVYDAAFEHNKAGTTLVHEYIHSLTDDAITTGKYRKELESLFNRAYVKAQREGLEFHGVSEIAFRFAQGNRGWTTSGQQVVPQRYEVVPHLHEFVAEALSNKKFQDFLARTRSPLQKGTIRTLWDEFVSWIGKSLGVKNTSALHDALRIGLDLASQRAKQKTIEPTTRGDSLDFLQPQETGGESPHRSVGAAMPSNIGTKAQIEQLADAFAAKASARERAAAFVRNAFNFGSKGSALKDAVSKAVAGLKESGQAVWDSLAKFKTPDELLKAKGDLSAELEMRGWRTREFVRNVQKAVPDVRRRAAIAKWIDAGGDDAVLATGESATKPAYKQAYRDARNLTPTEKIQAQNIANYFESRLQEAIDAGVLEHGLTDYIHRIYERDPSLQKRALAYVQSGILSKNPALAKKRFFQFDWEAEQAGFHPVQDFIPRVAAYEASLSKAIAARKFVQRMTQMTAPDGRPVVGIKGVGVPIEDPATGAREGTIIKPMGDFRKNQDATDPLNYRGDYENREYPSLSRWKWVASDAADKPIFVQGDVAVHPDYVGRMDALLEPSKIRGGMFPKAGKLALGLSSTVKQTMLDLSMFHQVQIAVHGLEHRVWPLPGRAPGFAKIIQDIDFENPDVQGLLKGGVTLGGDFYGSNLGEGLIGRSLTRHIPGLGAVMESYHSWLFQDFIPRVKMTMALHALERNKARYAKDIASGRMTPEALNLLTAKQANAAFGELNYTMLERSKTKQDMARLIMLAPDFLEARSRFVGQAFTKYGTEQRVALLLGAVTMWTLARVMNKVLDDQYHDEPENLFSIVYKGNSYGLRTVQGDVLHMLTKPIQFWLNRLNPVYTRTLLEAITQRDQFGRKRDWMGVAKDAVSTVIPIALRSNREKHLWESLLNATGVTARRYNDVKDAHALAEKWKKENNVREPPGEFIYDSDKDPLRPLKIALSEGDDADAVKALKSVLDSKVMSLYQVTQYFNRYASAPFSGSVANERRFMSSLSQDELKTVQAAQQHRKAMLDTYRKALNQIRGAYVR